MKKRYEIIENDEDQQKVDFYSRFKEKLEETHTFPVDYIFKYIVPAEQSIIAKLHAIFECEKSTFSTRDSKNGKYTSVTIKVPVNDANDIIIYYKQAEEIEGIMAL